MGCATGRSLAPGGEMSFQRLIVRWFAGLLLGTLIVAVTSPLFVRSYLPQLLDSVRGAYVPLPGQDFRWRSEGYATTLIGAHGMPGRSKVPSRNSSSIRVALWGDSQAEGVCVNDDQKLFTQIERVAHSRGKSYALLPFARSGENASHWLTQIPAVEKQLEIDAHLLVVVDLPDLLAATDAPLPAPMHRAMIGSQSEIAQRIPAFLIQSVRHLVTDDKGNRRQLRFSVGPLKVVKPEPLIMQQEVDWDAVWQRTMQAVRAVSERPIVILYAPISPHISAGKIVLHDPQVEQFQEMERAADAAGLLVVDASDALGDAARDGRWPFGFHNGQIGSGHLNAVGYELIAEQVADRLP